MDLQDVTGLRLHVTGATPGSELGIAGRSSSTTGAKHVVDNGFTAGIR